jgi:hypothetical protein
MKDENKGTLDNLKPNSYEEKTEESANKNLEKENQNSNNATNK